MCQSLWRLGELFWKVQEFRFVYCRSVISPCSRGSCGPFKIWHNLGMEKICLKSGVKKVNPTLSISSEEKTNKVQQTTSFLIKNTDLYQKSTKVFTTNQNSFIFTNELSLQLEALSNCKNFTMITVLQ